MRRRKSGHGNLSNYRRRRAQAFQQRERRCEAPLCAPCRKATWPTRAAARARMRQVVTRPDYVVRHDHALNVYPCPNGDGWHWGHFRASDDEQAS